MPSSFFLVHAGWHQYSVEIRHSRHLDQYYHFIMDLVWPLHHWIEGNVGWERLKCIHARDERSRYFADHFRAMLGKELRGMDRWARVLDSARASSQVQLHGLNSRARDYFKTFASTEDLRRSRASFVDRIARNCSGAEAFGKQPLVVLVERVPATDGRVWARRSIHGYQAISAAIAQNCQRLGAAFLDLRLEGMSFRESSRPCARDPPC
jgi:hypothetical protein